MVHERGVRYRGNAANADRDRERSPDGNGHTARDRDLDADGNANRNSNGNGDADSDDYADRNGYADADRDADANEYANKYGDADRDADAAPDRYAPADADADLDADARSNQDAASDRYGESGSVAIYQENNKLKILVDFHVHSEFSPDSVTKLSALIERAHELNLGKLVITDHNSIQGAIRLQKRYPDFVIVGEEILTTRGEILAFFVEEEIPAGLEPAEAFRRLRDQGAFISLSHPYSFSRHGWYEDEMIRYQEYLDAIEIANGRNTKDANEKATNFAKARSLCGTAGSDAHGLFELGRMALRLAPFSTAEELRAAIRNAEVVGTPSPKWVRIASRSAVLRKKFGLYRESGDPEDR